MTPFVFKKTGMNWLLFWGNWLTWQPPPPAQRELFILPSNVTVPKLDRNGYLWYEVRFSQRRKEIYSRGGSDACDDQFHERHLGQRYPGICE